jgi:hypothetical protein
MKALMKGAGILVLLTAAVGIAVPSPAQAPEPPSSASEEPGSVIVFPKFIKGKVTVDGVTGPQTEFEVHARCPNGAICPADEPVKIRFHWVCPGSEDIAPKYVCTETDFDGEVSVSGKVLLSPENTRRAGDYFGSAAPCPKGYLVGWVITPDTGRPIKYDALTGNAVLHDPGGAIESYEAIAIKADPNLAIRAEIATEIDSRTGTPALVFDGGPGHYQTVAGAVPTNLVFHKLTGPLSSSEAFLILLTLDVRLNRPNYPTVVDLEFRADQEHRASTSWNFRCWREIQNPNIGANFTLAGARTRNAVVISGQATKVPFRDISDIPGPVSLLGLVPTDEGHGLRTMDPAYIVKRFDSSKPTTVLVPSN